MPRTSPLPLACAKSGSLSVGSQTHCHTMKAYAFHVHQIWRANHTTKTRCRQGNG